MNQKSTIIEGMLVGSYNERLLSCSIENFVTRCKGMHNVFLRKKDIVRYHLIQ